MFSDSSDASGNQKSEEYPKPKNSEDGDCSKVTTHQSKHSIKSNRSQKRATNEETGNSKNNGNIL